MTVSYMLRIRVGVGRWTYQDFLDLLGLFDGDVVHMDIGSWMTPITIHSLSKEEAALIYSILTESYGAQIHQEVQRGSYNG
jgi:hypothetical protein